MNCYVSPYMDEEMKISQMIESLIAIMDANGDLEVETTFLTGDRVAAREPVLAHRAILNGRESKPRFASEYQYRRNDSVEDRKGEPVCRL